jgi:Ca2+-binding EF-hand superfamily protein
MLKLSDNEVSKCQYIFNDFLSKSNEDSKITYLQLKHALERAGIEFRHINFFHKMMVDNNKGITDDISLNDFLVIYESEKMKNQPNNENDMVEAFVAMGGNRDKSGEICTDKLINVINDFQMTIDIKKLIDQIDKDSSGTIDYSEFKSLFLNDSANIEDKKFKALFFG